MYFFDNYLYLREQYFWRKATPHVLDVWVLLLNENSSLVTVGQNGVQGEPSIANLAAASALSEVTRTGYSRQLVTPISVAMNTAVHPHQVQVTHGTIEWASIATGAVRIGAHLFYLKGADDEASLPIVLFDNSDTWPKAAAWSGPLAIASPSTGAIRASLG